MKPEWIVIEIRAEICGKPAIIEISEVPQGGGWHVYVDRYYWACVINRGGRWLCCAGRPPWWFTMAEMLIIEDIAEAAKPATVLRGNDFDHLNPHILRAKFT